MRARRRPCCSLLYFNTFSADAPNARPYLMPYFEIMQHFLMFREGYSWRLFWRLFKFTYFSGQNGLKLLMRRYGLLNIQIVIC